MGSELPGNTTPKAGSSISSFGIPDAIKGCAIAVTLIFLLRVFVRKIAMSQEVI